MLNNLGGNQTGPLARCLPCLCSQTKLLHQITTIQHGEPLEFEYDSKETDPEEPEDDPEEDEADTSVGSDSTYRSSSHDTDQTHRTNTINQNHRHNQRKHKENRGRCPTNTKKEEDRHKGKLVLSLFRDSPKEGAPNLH